MLWHISGFAVVISAACVIIKPAVVAIAVLSCLLGWTLRASFGKDLNIDFSSLPVKPAGRGLPSARAQSALHEQCFRRTNGRDRA